MNYTTKERTMIMAKAFSLLLEKPAIEHCSVSVAFAYDTGNAIFIYNEKWKAFSFARIKDFIKANAY